MDEKLLLDEALSFLGLKGDSSEDDLKSQYHKLAKKYHPDGGEFTSEILFQELQKHYEFLKKFWERNGSFDAFSLGKGRSSRQDHSFSHEPEAAREGAGKDTSSSLVPDPIFSMYKTAKEEETRAILNYFEKTKLDPMNLNHAKNNALAELRTRLDPVCKVYLDIVQNHPKSIWVGDSKDSLARLSVWWKQS
ncbi:J domain-containing protein [Leptospira idonii]|uniref:Molecular chaperone DnaJ n=1 Tax=Leptospira idonii TaxID=1193500 RepID=A0A4R9LVT7_9LEPT|nr:DnaJ domain-containing protein [Leptospira idonii]TGN16906.1 molecular chaperone DnaJ [Leptospira idonii]